MFQTHSYNNDWLLFAVSLFYFASLLNYTYIEWLLVSTGRQECLTDLLKFP